MAEIIPLAIGYGITDEQTWTMTPGEIMEATRARARQHTADFRLIDSMFARFTALFAAAHGVENAKPADFLTIPPEPEDEAEIEPQGMTAEQVQRFTLNMRSWVVTTGGALNV